MFVVLPVLYGSWYWQILHTVDEGFKTYLQLLADIAVAAERSLGLGNPKFSQTLLFSHVGLIIVTGIGMAFTEDSLQVSIALLDESSSAMLVLLISSVSCSIIASFGN